MEVDLQGIFGLHLTWCAHLYSLTRTEHENRILIGSLKGPAKDKEPDLKTGKGGHMVVGQDGELVHKGFEVIQQVHDADPVPGHLGGVSWTDACQQTDISKSSITLRVLHTNSIYMSIGTEAPESIPYCGQQRCMFCFKRCLQWKKILIFGPEMAWIGTWIPFKTNAGPNHWSSSDQNNEHWWSEQWKLIAKEQMWKMFGGRLQRRKKTTEENIPAHQNDAWTCPWPFYMEDWTRLNGPSNRYRYELLCIMR